MSQLDDLPLTFGKYKGKTPKQVSKYDPSYVVWMFSTVKPTPCSSRLFKTALHYMHEAQAERDADLFSDLSILTGD